MPARHAAHSNLSCLPNVDIYLFGIGAEIHDYDLKRLRVGTGGEHYFRMQEMDTLEETFDSIIGEDFLTRPVIQCCHSL